jgi:hypothetical protein
MTSQFDESIKRGTEAARIVCIVQKGADVRQQNAYIYHM